MRRSDTLESANPQGFSLEGIGTKGQITKLPSCSGSPPQQRTIYDKARTDAGAKRNEGQMIDALACAKPLLTKDRKVDIVFQDNLRSGGLSDGGPKVETVDTCNVRRVSHRTCDLIWHAGTADHRLSHLVAVYLAFRDGQTHKLADLARHRPPTIGMGRGDRFGNNRPGKIDNSNAHLCAAQINGSHEGAVRYQLIIGRCAPDMPRGSAGFANPSLLFKDADQFGNCLLG